MPGKEIAPEAQRQPLEDSGTYSYVGTRAALRSFETPIRSHPTPTRRSVNKYIEQGVFSREVVVSCVPECHINAVPHKHVTT